MKKIFYTFLLISPLLFIASCKKNIEGCTNPGACNYNPDANMDDGSCSGYPNNGDYSLYFDGDNILNNKGSFKFRLAALVFHPQTDLMRLYNNLKLYFSVVKVSNHRLFS